MLLAVGSAFVTLPVGLNIPEATLIVVVPFTEPVLFPVLVGPANVVPRVDTLRKEFVRI